MDRSTLASLLSPTEVEEIRCLLRILALLVRGATFQTTEPYTKVAKNLGKIGEELTMLANKLVSHGSQVDNANLTFDDIRISLNLLKYSYVCLSKELKVWLNGHSCSKID